MSRNPGNAGLARWSVLSLSVASLILGVLMIPPTIAQEPKKDEPKKDEPKKAEKKKRAERKEGPGRHEIMDYGQFLSASIKAPSPSDNNAMKGIAIKLGSDPQKPAAICYDTDLLRVSAGWTGGFLKLLGTPFDGSHGSWPVIGGTQVFGTRKGPGWAGPDGEFKDPRPEPFGPLPSTWAKYKGLYQSGDKVVISYTVGDVSVLEMPGVEGVETETPIITRTFNVGPISKPITLVVCDVVGSNEGGVSDKVASLVKGDKATFSGLIRSPEGVSWKIDRAGETATILLTLPASKAPVAFTLGIGAGAKGESAKFAESLKKSGASLDLARYTRGGPARWTQAVETKGRLSTGDGAYVVDTITAPDENPYKSWIRFGGMDFFADGHSAALSTWSGDVWTVTGIDEKLENLTWKRFATGLFQPLGLRIVDEKVYVLGRDGITRLR